MTPNPETRRPEPLRRNRRASAITQWMRRTRELRVLEGLKNGATVEALARREGVSARRIRALVNALLDANPDLEPADAFTQERNRHLDRALENLENDMRIGSRNASGQMLHISREFARMAEIERTKYAEISPKTES